MLGGWDGATGTTGATGAVPRGAAGCQALLWHSPGQLSGVLGLRYSESHGISTSGEGNFICRQIGTELVGNE